MNAIIRAMSKREIYDICDKIGYSPSGRPNGVAILAADGGIGAASIYDHWTYSSVQMHAWSEAPKYILHPMFDREIFKYPFVEQNKLVAITMTPCDNAPSLAVAKYLGFKELLTIPDGWKPGTGMVIQELRKTDCRFLEVADYAGTQQ